MCSCAMALASREGWDDAGRVLALDVSNAVYPDRHNSQEKSNYCEPLETRENRSLQRATKPDTDQLSVRFPQLGEAGHTRVVNSFEWH